MATSLTHHALDDSPVPAEAAGVAILRPLLAAAAMTDLDDAGWESILRDAREATSRLVASGELPAHLLLAHTDTPVVAARLIAAAWRHVTDAPSRRSSVTGP